MSLTSERELLSGRALLKTEIARELYKKYYFILFEIAKDLKNSNVKNISITDNSVIITTANEGIFLRCFEGEMTAALGQLILAGTERAEQAMLIALVRGLIAAKGGDNARTVVFDVGANIGWYSICLEKLFKGLQLHAFEPVPAAYQQFLENISLNQTGPIRINNFGLADAERAVDFYVSPSVLAASSLADTYQSGDKIKVRGKVRRLDDYCREHAVAPDLIKCDVEGAELLVFKGAARTLAEARPVVMTELLRKWAKCFNYHPNDVIRYFKGLGYSCHTLSEGKLRPFGTVTDETTATNYFFLHDQKHAGLISRIEHGKNHK
ncbi:MAG: FkbM family methyltransferase [Candidatus Saganbacteria bacterium]|nr:FkbM family methyltransferase [Candidatus Saganbacteria bacterium]